MNQVEAVLPQVVLSFPADMSDAATTEIVAKCDLSDPTVQVRRDSWGFSAGLEWAMPTMIVAYILKPYFDGLLKEAGKDHYAKLVAGLKRLAVLWYKERTVRVAASQSSQKLSANYQQSGLFSVVIQTRSGQLVKLLFDEALSQAEWEDAIEGMLATALKHYAQDPEDILTKSTIAQATRPTQQLYVVYNWDKKAWQVHNDHTMLNNQRGT